MKMNDTVFRQVRYSLYAAFVLNGIFIQWFVSFKYRCNYVNEPCFACGMRTAVNLLLKGKFIEAYQSNKLIIVAVVLAIIMITDVVTYLYSNSILKKRGR